MQARIITEEEYAKKYIKSSRVSEGAFGVIYLASDKKGFKYALKQSKSFLEIDSFKKQAEFIRLFDHPNILKVHELLEIKNRKSILIFPFYEKGTLKSFLKGDQSLSGSRRIQLCSDILEGITEIHSKGLMHRDLKPENILISFDKHAVICDFGTCLIESASEHQKQKKVGTPTYSAPEILKASKNHNRKCDVFSYGLILYFIFTGESLFRPAKQGEFMTQILRDSLKDIKANLNSNNMIEPTFRPIILDCLQEKIDKRISISELQSKYSHEFNCYKGKLPKISPIKEPKTHFEASLIKLFMNKAKGTETLTKINAIQSVVLKSKYFKQQLETLCESRAINKYHKNFLVFLKLWELLYLLIDPILSLIEIKDEDQKFTDSIEILLQPIYDLSDKIIGDLAQSGCQIYKIRNLMTPKELFSESLMHLVFRAKDFQKNARTQLQIQIERDRQEKVRMQKIVKRSQQIVIEILKQEKMDKFTNIPQMQLEFENLVKCFVCDI